MPGRSRGPASDADEFGEERYGLAALDREPAAKIIPEADVQLGACLDQPEESIAAVASKVASRAAADFAFGDLAADVVLRAVGMQRDFRAVERHQQFRLVGVQPHEQSVQHGKPGAAHEDAIKARATPYGGARSDRRNRP